MSDVQPAPRRANDDDEAAKLHAEIREELEKAGIHADDPIRPVFEALINIFDRIRHLAENAVARMDGMWEIVNAEIALMKKAMAASEAQTRKLEGMAAVMDVRAHAVLTQTINQMAGEVAERMRDRMVIVERRHNRWVLLRTGALLAAVLLATLGGGYAWCAHADRNATALMERCLTHPFQDPRTGQLFCQLQAPQSSQ
jgi:hypothetical protein